MRYATEANPDRNRVVKHPVLLAVIAVCARAPLQPGLTAYDLGEVIGRSAANWRGDLARGWIRLRFDQIEPYLGALAVSAEDVTRFRLALHLAHAPARILEEYYRVLNDAAGQGEPSPEGLKETQNAIADARPAAPIYCAD